MLCRRVETLTDGTTVEDTRMLSMGPVVFETLGAIQALSHQAELLEKEIALLEQQLLAS